MGVITCDVCDKIPYNVVYCCNCDFRYCYECLEIYNTSLKLFIENNKYKNILEKDTDFNCKSCIKQKIDNYSNAFF